MKRLALLLASTVGVVALAAVGTSDAAVTHARIQGSGSGWAANAVNQWIADVTSQGMQVDFNSNGAAQGRKDFANGTTDYGVSDIPYQGVDPKTGLNDVSTRPYVYLPIVAGGTAFPYQIKQNGQLIRNLRLSGQTLAKIFTNQITNWNDPQIKADNNGMVLPNLPIIPVVNSQGSGSTAQFTRFLAKQYPAIWGPFNGGSATMTEYFPRQGKQIAAGGSDQVINYVTSNAANGAIGYDEYSYAKAVGFPSAKILNTAGYYTLPTQYNVAVALTKAHINTDKTSTDYLTQNLDGVYVNSDNRTYPLSSYTYAIIPTSPTDPRMTTAKRQTLVDFLYHSICQGQREIGPVGYSPLPINLVQAGFDQINKLKDADPAVDITLRDVSTCDNPTFIAGQPNVNHLAQIAPLPAACDKQGAGPCASDVGTYNGNPNAGSTATSVAAAANAVNKAASSGNGRTTGTSGGTGITGTSGTGNAGSQTGGSAPTGSGTILKGFVVDPATGQQVAQSGDTTTNVSATSTVLSNAASPSSSSLLAVLSVVSFALAVVVPVLVHRRLAGRASPR